MSKHNKGPWKIHNQEIGIQDVTMIIDAEDNIICEMVAPSDEDVDNDEQACIQREIATAKLMAAAPELLEACIKTLNKLQHMTTDQYLNGGDHEIRKLLAVTIKKATE